MLTAALAGAAPAIAQEEPAEATPEFVVDVPTDDKTKDGWDFELNAASNLSLSDNRSVVAQTEGTTITFGYQFDARFDFLRKGHEFRSSLRWSEGLTQTPAVEEVVKARDELEKEMVYLYHVVPIFGPFARVSMRTPTFVGSDVRAEPTTFVVTRLDGSTETSVVRRFRLTDALRPLTLKESVGAFLQPVTIPEIALEHRLGLGARQTLADDQFALDDDEATDEVEVIELDDVVQVGVEAVTTVEGAFDEGRLGYRAGAEIMLPFVFSELPAGDDRTAFDLMNVEAYAELKARFNEVLSLDYQLKAVREPQLLDKVQLQNNLLISIGVNVVKTTRPKPEVEE